MQETVNALRGYPIQVNINERNADSNLPKKTSLVLAGGLGSSAYVQSKLRARYDPQGMKLLVEKNPEEPYVPTIPIETPAYN